MRNYRTSFPVRAGEARPGMTREVSLHDREAPAKRKAVTVAKPVAGRCLCGAVCFEIDFPARWAWHDHSAASRRAHGAACATYVGSWRKRFRFTKGAGNI